MNTNLTISEKANAIDKASYATKQSSVGVAIKDVDTTSRTVTGYFSTFNFLDSDNEVILPGAFKRSLKYHGVDAPANSPQIKHALFHDLTKLPGKIKVLKETTSPSIAGLYFETEMSDTELGNDTIKLYMDKVYDNHSIGYQYNDQRFIDNTAKDWDKEVAKLLNPELAQERGWFVILKEVRLFEGSTVAFGANSFTPFLGIKSMTKENLLYAINEKHDKLESVLRTGTITDDSMRIIEVHVAQLKQMTIDLEPYLIVDAKALAEIHEKQRKAAEVIPPPSPTFQYTPGTFRL